MELPEALTRSRPGEDLLGRVETVRVFHVTSRLSEPWGIAMPPVPQVAIHHLLTSGRDVVTVDGVSYPLGPGDLAVV